MDVSVNPIVKRVCPSILLVIVLLLSTFTGAGAADTTLKTIAIIPFETNSKKDLTFIQNGVLQMLRSRLMWKGQVQIMPRSRIDQALSGMSLPMTNQSVLAFGKKTGADYVITGGITEFSGAFSVDTKVYDLEKQIFLTFFSQAKDINAMITQVDVVAAKINKKIFERTTIAYEKFQKEKIITEEELRRMNPERMMPARRQRTDNDDPWWKLW